jgi:hypothetical protein
MKRKIFSKLLMGAFLIASVSAFVSCKDYDDDINANKAEIKAVQDQLSTLTSNLNSLQTELQTQKTALQQELATAKSQLETQIADAKAQLTTAIEKKADQASVDALASKVATLESNLAALNAAYEAKMSAIDSAIASLQAIIEKKADISYVDNAIAILNSAIDGKVAKDDFGAFKGEVNNLKNDLNNLSALVETKADKKDIDHAVENINAKLADLIEQMKITVPQTEIANIQKTIEALQNSVNALTQAVAAKAEQSAVDQLNAFYKELKEQVNTLVTPEQLASAIQTLKEEVATKGAEESARLEGLIAQVQKAVDENKAAGEKALKDAVEEINTALGTKASVDDLEKAVSDFNAAKKAIEEDIATKYAAVTGKIDDANKLINDINDALKAEIAKKADLADFNKFKQDFANLKLDERLIACEALIEQVAAINKFLGDLKTGTLASKLADLEKNMSEDAAKKVKAEAEDRAKAIEDVQKEISDLQTNLNKQIADLNKKLYGDGEVSGDIDKLQADTKQLTEDFSKIDQKIQDGIDENLSNLMVFVQRMLTSVTLIPQHYIDGIEAIKFTSLRYIPKTPDYSIVPANYDDDYDPADNEGTTPPYFYNFSDHQLVNVKGGSWVIIDNGETLAEYRVSPKSVSKNTIDTANIKIYSTTATTVTRAAALQENIPVKPTFVSLASNGNLTVKLQKTRTGSIRFEGEGSKGTIVSLSVPRKADPEKNIESTEIYSEYSLLDEETIVPRIAALPWVKSTDHNASSPMDYHFIDSLHIFGSYVDKDLYVKAEIDFDKPFDLLTLVTGCKGLYDDKTGAITGHEEIKKAELAKYGLAFRFQLPEKYEYKSQNYNFTDQQQFAVLSENNPHNIIRAKLPQDQEIFGNRAVIGKEPIVRVMLVDTVRNNLVDQAYFKVKFVDNLPDKPAINVEYTADAQVLDCDGNALRMKWDKFINLVYASLKDSEGEVTGMSWDQFRKYYPQTNVYRADVTPMAKFNNGTSMIWHNSNEKGDVRIYWLSWDPSSQSPDADANELYWDLNEKLIGAIDKTTRKKDLTTKVQFRSNDPKVYGPINLTLKITIKLPDTPTIVGYNENQWFASQEKFYVQPVQYGTTNNEGVRPEFVEYDFNMTQQFTVTTETDATKNYKAGTWKNWIVKGMPTFYDEVDKSYYNCGAWDVQFATAQNGLKYRSAYKNSKGQFAEPNLSSQLTADNLAYKYINDKNKEALNIWWIGDDNHYSWTDWNSSDADYPFFILHGDKETADQIIPLLNDLSQKNRADNWTPEKTYDDNKAIDMKVWVKYNDYNWEEITAFKAYLVTPVRVNFTAPGAFEDNWVSGTKVDAAGKLSITDFVGYAVAKSLSSFTAAQQGQERYKYAEKLWKYYGMNDPVFNLGDNDVIYGLKIQNGDLVVDDAVTIDETGGKVVGGGMKASAVAAATAGGYTPSLTYESGYLLYKNKQGREFEKPYNIFVPVTIKHIFGTLKTYVPFPVYPKGKAIGDGYTVVPGPEVSARMR